MNAHTPKPTTTLITTDTFKTIRSGSSPRLRIQTAIAGESKTQQSFKDECDINRIMAQYLSTGELPNVNAIPPQYLDVTEMDFQAHQNYVAEAMSLFNQLPSAIRTRFENNPGKFLDFCSHEKNRPELAEMGLLRPIAEPLVSTPHLTPTTGAMPVPADSASAPSNPK